MSESVKIINDYFRTATRSEVDGLLGKIVLSERQQAVFDMYYIKRKDVGFIADTLGFCKSVITNELSAIREKISLVRRME